MACAWHPGTEVIGAVGCCDEPPQHLSDQAKSSEIPELAYQSILPPPIMNSRTPLSVSPQMAAPLTVARRKVQPKAGERRSPAWNAHKQCPMGGSLALGSAVLPRGVCKTGTSHREPPANMSHCSLKSTNKAADPDTSSLPGASPAPQGPQPCLSQPRGTELAKTGKWRQLLLPPASDLRHVRPRTPHPVQPLSTSPMQAQAAWQKCPHASGTGSGKPNLCPGGLISQSERNHGGTGKVL